jgi:hypothetical protein
LYRTKQYFLSASAKANEKSEVRCVEFAACYTQIFDDKNNASIGLVWHRNLIDQMLGAPLPVRAIGYAAGRWSPSSHL